VTPSENAQFAALRTDLMEEIAGLRSEVQPAVNFYNNLARFGEAVAKSGRFAKWGAAFGASIVTILGGLRVLGIL
jgi:hypothetical protein